MFEFHLRGLLSFGYGLQLLPVIRCCKTSVVFEKYLGNVTSCEADLPRFTGHAPLFGGARLKKQTDQEIDGVVARDRRSNQSLFLCTRMLA